MSELVQRDRDDLLQVLEQVDVEGWDGPAGRDLLLLVREMVVAPLAVKRRLFGAATEQAIASGWAAAWEVLRSPAIRTAESPWGVIWVAARRAVLNEQIAATTGRNARATGWEPAADEPAEPPVVIPVVVDLMVEVGWDRAVATDVMDAVAHAAPWGEDSGWRWIANRVEAQPWQIRRLINTLIAHRQVLVDHVETPTHGLDAVREDLRLTMKKRVPLDRLAS